MAAFIAAPRIIGGNMQKFFASGNLCQDGSGRIFCLYIMIIAKFFISL